MKQDAENDFTTPTRPQRAKTRPSRASFSASQYPQRTMGKEPVLPGSWRAAEMAVRLRFFLACGLA